MCNVFPGEGKQPFKLEEYTIIFPNCSRVVFIMSRAQVPPPQKNWGVFLVLATVGWLIAAVNNGVSSVIPVL